MRAIIDANSLVNLSRFYLPFDSDGHLLDLVKSKIQSGEIIITDRVLNECKSVSGGLVLTAMSFLNDPVFLKKYRCPFNTDTIFAPDHPKFLAQVDDDFQDKGVRKAKGLSEAQYQAQKTRYLETGDMKVVLTCLHLKEKFPKEEIIIISDESSSQNDNKLFKKIPLICKTLGLPIMTIPQAMKTHYRLKGKFS